MTDVAEIEEGIILSPENLPGFDPFMMGDAPTMLYLRGFPGQEIIAVCGVRHTGVFKDDRLVDKVGYISADVYIERKAEEGFRVMSIAIVRHDKSTVVQEIQHEIITVLVKLKNP